MVLQGSWDRKLSGGNNFLFIKAVDTGRAVEMETGSSTIKINFIRAVVDSGLSFMDVACISSIPEISLFKYAGGGWALEIEEEDRLCTILRCSADVFEE